MKRILLFIVLMAVGMGLAQAQIQRECAAHTLHEEKMANDPAYRLRQEKIEANYQRFVERGGLTNAATGIRTIPVYVHVIYNNSQENISEAQIQSQIAVLNDDYSATNSDISNVPSEFASSVANYEIQFELVQITRKQSSKTEWGTNDAMKDPGQGGVAPITPDTHLNMWVCNIGGGILGYAQFPGGDPTTDGVVMSPQYFGSSDYGSFYLSAPFDKGRTATHEVGHYLNLRHIWGDGNCNADDFVSDTPTAGSANYGCPSYPSKSCNSNGGYTSDMFMNYMDYVDDACMYMFTEGQKTRTASVFAPGGSRENLGTVGGGCALAAPSGLNSSNIGDNSFTVSWSSVSGAASYDVSVDGAVSNVSGTSYSASGLSAGTSYTVKVRSICSDGGSGSYSSDLIVTTTGTAPVTYCSSNGNNTNDEYIGRVQLGSLNNSSAAGSGGYSDYTALSTDLSVGVSNTITITPTWTGTVYSEGYSVWIDYNKDGDFTDTGEQVWSQSATKNTTVGGSFTVPAGTASGNTRMRVSMKYNGVPTSCESFSYGEVEDYTVNIVSGGADTTAPSVPSGLSVIGTTETSTTLSWNASSDNVGVTGFDIFVNGSLNGSSSTTSYGINGLSVNTTYSLTVRAKDAAGNTSAQSSGLNITTPDLTAPSAVAGLSASGTTQTTTTLSWSASSDNVGVAGYDIYVNGSLDGNSGSTSYAVSGLTASTTYSMSVVAKDAAGNESSSSSINVTTEDAPSGGGCAGGISSFPYSEGFESGLGLWSQATGDDLDWTRDASGTPSSSTGPSSATEGSYYMYVESSSPNYPSKTTVLNGPCVDLSAETGATFGFAYHMYGSSMGSLSFEASTDGVSWNSLWSRSGDQGNAWSNANVDLGPYAGATVQVRFVGVTGSSYRSDMAIDNISISTGSAGGGCSDVTLTLKLDNYPEETSWTLKDGSGATVASGGTYGSQPDGSTVVETACLEDGCYTFTINDAYGDGICCNYGNGNYSLTDASGTVLASGGSFTSSQSTDFCLTGGSASRTARLSGEFNDAPALLHPNPVSDYLFIKAPKGTESMSIITTNGVQVNNVAFYEDGVDVSRLKAGAYMVIIKTEKGIVRDRFIKQ